MSRFYVYSLAYPNGEVFYIGKGGGVGSRTHSHTWEAKSGKAGRKSDIIRSILATGEAVLTNILFETDDEDQAYDEEIRFISLFDKDKLVNVPGHGGRGGGGRISRPEPSTTLQVYLPASIKAEAEVAAEAAGQLMSVFVTRAIIAHVLRAKDDARPETMPTEKPPQRSSASVSPSAA